MIARIGFWRAKEKKEQPVPPASASSWVSLLGTETPALEGGLAESPRMKNKKLVPAGRVRNEIEIRRSRFIATLAPASSVDEAKDFIESVREEFRDATHNVPAYVIGHGSSLTAHCNDDGEPSGTAGRPVLTVLRGSGLGDIAAVVTRYFGGVKLGTGGLVRAYSESVRQALDRLPRAQKIATHTIKAVIPYSFHQILKQSLAEHQAELLREEFLESVTLHLRLPSARLEDFQRRLADITAGNSSAEITSTDPESTIPLPEK